MLRARRKRPNNNGSAAELAGSERWGNFGQVIVALWRARARASSCNVSHTHNSLGLGASLAAAAASSLRLRAPFGCAARRNAPEGPKRASASERASTCAICVTRTALSLARSLTLARLASQYCVADGAAAAAATARLARAAHLARR